MKLKVFIACVALMLLIIEESMAKPEPAGGAKPKIPDYIHICHRTDPKLNECIRDTVHAMRPYLANGIEELNVPSMEPLYIGDLNVLEGGSSGFNIKAKNLNIYGAGNFEIKKLTVLDDGKRLDFELALPRLNGEGTYNVNGKLLALPLKGSGPFSGNFTNFKAFVKVQFNEHQVNGVDYLAVKSLDVKIKMGKGRVRLSNLFNGDKALGDTINDSINQNFEVFAAELIPPIERALEKKFSSMGSEIFNSFSYDELFPV